MLVRAFRRCVPQSTWLSDLLCSRVERACWKIFFDSTTEAVLALQLGFGELTHQREL